MSEIEDPRKTGLKNGLRQLNIEQLKRVIEYPGEMILDELNYQDGKFCPLAIALQLDEKILNPSHNLVYEELVKLGYKVYNTRGIEGKFYTDNRKEDLLIAAKEVLQEKTDDLNWVLTMADREDEFGGFPGFNRIPKSNRKS